MSDDKDFTWPCSRCGDDESGGYSLKNGDFVCDDCLTDAEKQEIAEFWTNLEGDHEA